MAEATRPGEGGVTCYTSFPELKTRKAYSGEIAAVTSETNVIFYDANHDAYICQAWLEYSVTGTGTAATISVGIDGATTALVNAGSISASAAAGTVAALTLTTANNSTTGSSTGFYKVPAGTPLIATATTGGANNAIVRVGVDYVLIDKGIG